MGRTCWGEHPFRSQCIRDLLISYNTLQAHVISEAVRRVESAIENEFCPRCSAELLPGSGHHPGSIVTPCRCIPICAVCEDHEGLGSETTPEEWPLDAASVQDEVIVGYVEGDVYWMDQDGELRPADPDPNSSIYERVRQLRLRRGA
jgi:hypothetical protein